MASACIVGGLINIILLLCSRIFRVGAGEVLGEPQ